MNVLAACSGPDSPVRKIVFKSTRRTTTAASATTPPSSPRRCSARTRRARRSSATSSRPSRRCSSFAERNRDVTVTTCASPTGSGPACTRATSRCSRCPRCPSILGFDPRYQFIHEDDIVARARARRAQRPARALQRRRRRRAGALGDRRACSASRSRRCCRPGARASPPARSSCSASGPAARDAQPAALRARPGQPQAQGRGLPLPPHDARDRAGASREHLRVAPTCATATRRYRYEREVEEFLRYSPRPCGRIAADDLTRQHACRSVVAGTPLVLPFCLGTVRTRSFLIVATARRPPRRGDRGRLRLRQRAHENGSPRASRRRHPVGGMKERRRRARSCAAAVLEPLTGRWSPTTRHRASRSTPSPGARRRRHRRLDPAGDRRARARATSSQRTGAQPHGRRGQADLSSTSPTTTTRSTAWSCASAAKIDQPGARRHRRTSRRATSPRRRRPTGLAVRAASLRKQLERSLLSVTGARSVTSIPRWSSAEGHDQGARREVPGDHRSSTAARSS